MHQRGPDELSFLQQLHALRDGRMTTMRLDDLDGLITFPSFHVATAVLVAYATRGTQMAFLACVLNGFMVASVLTEGGHYLVDVAGGAAVAVLSIAVVRLAMPPLRAARTGALRQGRESPAA